VRIVSTEILLRKEYFMRSNGDRNSMDYIIIGRNNTTKKLNNLDNLERQ